MEEGNNQEPIEEENSQPEGEQGAGEQGTEETGGEQGGENAEQTGGEQAGENGFGMPGGNKVGNLLDSAKNLKNVKDLAQKAKLLKNVSMAAPLAKIILIAGLIILVLIILIGIISFFVFMPGMVKGKIKAMATSFYKWCTSVTNGSQEPDYIEIAETADYIESMGYDLKGYGFVSEDEVPATKAKKKKENLDGTYFYENDNVTLDKNMGVLRFEDNAVAKIKSEPIYNFLVSDNLVYILKNKNISYKSISEKQSSWRKWLSVMPIINVAITTQDLWRSVFGGDPKYGDGLIAIYKDGGEIGNIGSPPSSREIEIDRDAKTLKLTRGWFNNTSKVFSLDGWTGRYGKPLELLLSLHIATMAPDLAMEITQNKAFDTEILLLLHDVETEVLGLYKSETGEMLELRDIQEARGVTRQEDEKIWGVIDPESTTGKVVTFIQNVFSFGNFRLHDKHKDLFEAKTEDGKKAPVPHRMPIFGVTGMVENMTESMKNNITDALKNSIPKPDFSNIDLSKLDLSKMNPKDIMKIPNIDLSKIDFSGVDLSKLDLSKIDLSKVNPADMMNIQNMDPKDILKIPGANLSNMDFSNVDLSKLDLSKLDLSKINPADIINISNLNTMDIQNLFNMDLSKVDLSKMNPMDIIKIPNIDFSNMDLSKINLSQMDISQASSADIMKIPNINPMDIIKTPGINLSNVDFSNVDFSKVDLSKMDISQASSADIAKMPNINPMDIIKTPGVNLSNVDFSNVDFSKVDLSKMDISKVSPADVERMANMDPKDIIKIPGVNLSNVDFPGVDFSKVDLSNMDISKVNSADMMKIPNMDPKNIIKIPGVNLSNVDFPSVDFSKVDLSKMDISKVNSADIMKIPNINPKDIIKIPGVNLSNVDFSNIDFSKVDISKVNPLDIANIPGIDPMGILKNANIDFSNIDFSKVNPKDIINIPNIDLSNIDFSKADFSKLNVPGIDISNMNPADIIKIPGINLSNIDFSKVDFSNMNLSNINPLDIVNIPGIDLSKINSFDKNLLDMGINPNEYKEAVSKYYEQMSEFLDTDQLINNLTENLKNVLGELPVSVTDICWCCKHVEGSGNDWCPFEDNGIISLPCLDLYRPVANACRDYNNKLMDALEAMTDQKFKSYVPYISEVKNHWFRDTYFVETGRGDWSQVVLTDEDYERETKERWSLFEVYTKKSEFAGKTGYKYTSSLPDEFEGEYVLSIVENGKYEYETEDGTKQEITYGIGELLNHVINNSVVTSYAKDIGLTNFAREFKIPVQKIVITDSIESTGRTNKIMEGRYAGKWSAYKLGANINDTNPEMLKLNDETPEAVRKFDEKFGDIEKLYVQEVVVSGGITQVEDAVRIATNPTIKELFLKDKYFIYDGTGKKADMIREVKIREAGSVDNFYKKNRAEKQALIAEVEKSIYVFEKRTDNDGIQTIKCVHKGNNINTIRNAYSETNPQGQPQYEIIEGMNLVGKVSIDRDALSVFSILENMNSLDADYIYKDLKELIVELNYFDKEDLKEPRADVLGWVLPDVDSGGWPIRRWDKNENYYGTLIHSQADYDAKNERLMDEVEKLLGDDAPSSGTAINPTGSDGSLEQFISKASEIHRLIKDFKYCVLEQSNPSITSNGGKGRCDHPQEVDCKLTWPFRASLNENPGLSCCATYVCWALYESGYASFYGTNGARRTYEICRAERFKPITTIGEVKPGDIAFMGASEDGINHTEIKGADGWYNAGSTSAMQGGARSSNPNNFYIAMRPYGDIFKGYEPGEDVTSPVTGEVLEAGTWQRINQETGEAETVGYIKIRVLDEEDLDILNNIKIDKKGDITSGGGNVKGYGYFFNEYKNGISGNTIYMDGFNTNLRVENGVLISGAPSSSPSNNKYVKKDTGLSYTKATDKIKDLEEKLQKREDEKANAQAFIQIGGKTYIKEGTIIGTTRANGTNPNGSVKEGNYIRIVMRDKRENAAVENIEEYMKIAEDRTTNAPLTEEEE